MNNVGSPAASQRTFPSHPRWSCRCRAVKPRKRWCVRTGRSPAAWARLVYTLTRCQRSHSATDREGNLPPYTAEGTAGRRKGQWRRVFAQVSSVHNFFILFSHLHIEKSWSISRPLLDDAHVVKHGLMLRHALQPGPLLQNTGPCGRRLLLHPHLQHLLLLHLQKHSSVIYII